MNTLNLTLTNHAGLSRPLIFIEQDEPDPTDGYLSRAGLYRAVYNLLAGEEQEEPTCQPGCAINLYVYRDDLTLNYKLYASHGELGPREIQDNLTFTQKIRVGMEDTVELAYPNFGVVKSEWVGGMVWNYDGERIAAPSFSESISSIHFSRPVYGTLLLTYRINRDRYSFIISPRETAEENKYSTVAFAIYKPGPPVWLEIDIPPGVEETDQQCTGGGGGGGKDPDEPDPFEPPYAPNTDAEIVIDYCSQEVVSDSTK